MNLLILSDGKKGHENQSLGLAEALLRRHEGGYQLTSISELPKSGAEKVHAVIAAGHRTHPFLLRAARHHRCPSVVIMKPSLPRFLFSHCLIPEHDLRNLDRVPRNVIATKGALNRIPETIPAKQEKGLILLGGPSKHFLWDSPALLTAIQALLTAHPHLPWTIGDSRRTPPEFLSSLLQLSQKGLPFTLIPHQESGPDWLRDELLTSQVAWVTPDSTSMLSEALTAGCQVGTLPLKPLPTRLSKAHDLLVAQGWVTPFQSHPLQLPLPPPPHRLHETARCADLLLPRLLS